MCRQITVFIFLFLFSMTVQAAQLPDDVATPDVVLPTYVTSMRIFPATTKTVIYFDLTSKAAGAVKFIPVQHKLILKFENTKLRFSVTKARFRNANISAVYSREIPDKSAIFYFDTTGAVDWSTDYEVNMDVKGTRMRLEVISVDAQPQPTSIKKNNKKHNVNNEVLRELGKYRDKLEKLKVEQQEVFGRSRWEKHKIKEEAAKTHLFTIVIDAGHGGKDPGAIGKNGLREKDVVLNISKKIAERLEKNQGIRVVMTRSGDYYVPLRARLNAARRDDADLFIAVHADAYFNNKAKGASVYALSQHGATSEASRWLMQQENHSELDGINFDNLSDRSRMVRSVLIDLSQTATIRDSLRLGNKVLDALDRIASLHHNQVEQAPFVVLKSPDIPSILIETGFITNPDEELRLFNPRYQDKIADAVAQGVQAYIRKYAGR